MKFRCCMLALLCPFFYGHSQTVPITPLEYGDTLPPLLLSNVINSDQSVINLQDTTVQLYILDFWSANCGSCYYTLANLDSLQRQHNDIRIISITSSDSANHILSLLNRIPVTRNMKLPVVLFDSVLHQYFPHLLISHLVWLDKNRKFIASTNGDYASNEKIAEAKAGKSEHWNMKRDVLDFDYRLPLLIPNPAINVAPGFIYTSSFTGHMEGIAPPTSIIRDSLAAVTRFSFYNLSLQEFSQLAVYYGTANVPKPLYLNVKNRKRFIKPANIPLTDWEKDNTYCYSVTLPLEITETQLRARVRKDLLQWLEMLNVRIRPLKRSAKQSVRFEIVEIN